MKRNTEVRAEARLESLWTLAAELAYGTGLRCLPAMGWLSRCGGHGGLGTVGSLAWCPAFVPKGIAGCGKRAMDRS